MTPESVGWAKNSLVLGKHSGRAAFRDKLKTLGYQIGDNQLNDAFRRFKDLADRKKVVFDDDIVALVDDEVMRDHERIRFVSLDLHAGSKSPPRAEMELEVDGVVKSATASGDGPVDATFKAIQQIFPHTANLVLFSVGAVTEGTDAQAKTTVRLEENGKMVDGQGADTDTIVASARAYVHALNKLLVKRVRTEPAGAVSLNVIWRPANRAGCNAYEDRRGLLRSQPHGEGQPRPATRTDSTGTPFGGLLGVALLAC